MGRDTLTDGGRQMSELKAMTVLNVLQMGCYDNVLVYFKSEADEVIAEKDREIVELKKLVHDYAQGLYVMQAMAEKEARHSNHKRCLDVSMWCDTKADWYYSISGFSESFRDCVDFYIKWRDKWKELAEKFK